MAAKILLVEDDYEQALLFSRVLTACGYVVIDTAIAEEAQAKLAAEPFDLLLADWDLGSGMNGDALINWAKARYSDLKAILFSNHQEVNEMARACGADAAFSKVEGITPLRQLVSSLVPLKTGHA